MSKVFLGGTCNGTNWRELLIDKLQIKYFNPVVEDWTEEAQQIEKHEKTICDLQLYVITPQMSGVFSIAEVVDSSNKLPKGKTVLTLLKEWNGEEFTKAQWKSILAVAKMVENNGAKVLYNIRDTSDYLNLYKD